MRRAISATESRKEENERTILGERKRGRVIVRNKQTKINKFEHEKIRKMDPATYFFSFSTRVETKVREKGSARSYPQQNRRKKEIRKQIPIKKKNKRVVAKEQQTKKSFEKFFFFFLLAIQIRPTDSSIQSVY